MASVLLGRPVLCLHSRGQGNGSVFEGKLWSLFQLPRTRPKISPFGRRGRHGPRHAALCRESGASARVRILLLPDPDPDFRDPCLIMPLLTSCRTANREPLLLNPGEGRPETHLIGISGGLWNAVSVPTSANFSTLYDTCIEAGRVYARLCNLTLVRSRAMEDAPGIWGWAVVGVPAEELEKILEQFQQAMVSSALPIATNACRRID